MYFLYHLRYYYKFIIGGQWRHSTASPTERDERGNLNNIIVVGDVANVRPTARQEKKVNLLNTDHLDGLYLCIQAINFVTTTCPCCSLLVSKFYK